MRPNNHFRRSPNRLMAGVCGLLVALASSVAAKAAEAGDVPILFPAQEKVLYFPIRGEAQTTQRIRAKEVSGIERFFRARNLAAEPVVTPVNAAEAYQQLEPLLAVEAREEACQGKEASDPLETLGKVQQAYRDGSLDDASSLMGRLREALACSQTPLSRSQAVEVLLWSGLTHTQATGPEAERFLWSALALDPLLVESLKAPAPVVSKLQRMAGELEQRPRVDLHLPQGEGDLWSFKNILLDGRRLVPDKLFLQVVPGIHLLQLSLSDGRLWSAFLEIQPGAPDLTALAREHFKLKVRYTLQLEKLLAEGYAGPALLQGLKVYAIKLQKSQVYLAGVSEEDDGTWITIRRFHVDRGIEVPELSRLAGNQSGAEPGLTASVPITLSLPWALELDLLPSLMTSGGIAFQSPGAGVELDVWYQPGPRLQLGLLTGLGARLYELYKTDGQTLLYADADAQLGAGVRLSVPLGTKANFLPELGYIAHVNPLRGLPGWCKADALEEYTYDCSLTPGWDAAAQPFNLRGRASGPRVRLGLELTPFGSGALTMRLALKAGYAPLFVSFREEMTAQLTAEDDTNTEGVTGTLRMAADSRSLLLHELSFGLGIHGTY